MSNQEQFSLDRFEKLVYGHNLQEALHELLRMLSHLSVTGPGFARVTPEQVAGTVACPEAARMASALSAFLANPNVCFDLNTFRSLVVHHRHFASIYAAAGMGNADHIISVLLTPPTQVQARPRITGANLAKLGLLYCGDSNAEVSFEQLWKAHPETAMDTFLGVLSHPVQMTEQAHAKREQLLTWLPSRLREMKLCPHHLMLLDRVSMYMSYAFTPRKHDLKASLNKLLAAWLKEQDVKQLVPSARREIKERPVMLVPLERFGFRHAMYRCFAPMLRAMREKFELVGMGLGSEMDDTCRALFDRVIVFSYPIAMPDLVNQVQQVTPDVIFYPSIGMRQVIIALASLRLAPIQLMTLGHPATSRSPNIDYILVEEGYLGDPGCFSENIVLLPNHSTPFEMRRDAVAVPPKERGDDEIIRIAVPSKHLKLNVRFLNCCRGIKERANKQVEFYFFPGATGILHAHVASVIRRIMPTARVYPTTAFNTYIRNLNQCDMQLSTFPFGNTNSLLDGARQGLPIVCMDGREVHSHIDSELLRRLNLPPWLTAHSEQEYEDTVLRLVENSEERLAIGKALTEQDLDELLFSGDATEYAEVARWIYENHETMQADGRKVWTVADRKSTPTFPTAPLLGPVHGRTGNTFNSQTLR